MLFKANTMGTARERSMHALRQTYLFPTKCGMWGCEECVDARMDIFSLCFWITVFLKMKSVSVILTSVECKTNISISHLNSLYIRLLHFLLRIINNLSWYYLYQANLKNASGLYPKLLITKRICKTNII